MIEIQDNRNPEDYSRCSYFVLEKGEGTVDTPVRVVYDHEGLEMGADTVNAQTATLVKNAALSSQAFNSPFSSESNEEEFWTLCEAKVTEFFKK